ncbi:MAG: hypothetical protein P1U68_11105 [Verrucomicrobiales bacterium]|nr:hypothetical protein [Verrucomicrobiales bacterium]
MLRKLVPIAIVGFWFGSIAWLCAVVWAPPESRMARVDPREVFEVFFAWNESTRMTLLDHGSRRGEINIAGSSGNDVKTGKFANTLSLTGSIDALDPANDEPGIDLFWRGFAEFDTEIVFDRGEFSVRVPARSLTAHAAFEGLPPVVKASLTMGDETIFKTDSSQPSIGFNALQMLPMASMLGLEKIDQESLKFDIAARMGEFNFGGRDLRAYLLTLSSGKQGGSGVKVFLSEVGEPLRIESDLGFEAISEILMPLDAYSKKKETKTDD